MLLLCLSQGLDMMRSIEIWCWPRVLLLGVNDLMILHEIKDGGMEPDIGVPPV